MENDNGNEAGDRNGAEGASGAERLSAPPDDGRVPRLPFSVVGVGASAGGLEAYTEFLQAASVAAGVAYVLVQHLPPDRESLLVELLSRHTRMPVVEVTDGQAVEKDHVYVIRPGHTLTIKDGRLRLGPELAARGHGRPVDDFFRSLAEEQQQRAVAVVFSGMGSNGTAGAQAVKAVGGLVIAQEPDSAKFPAMPRSLIDAHLADFILRPGEVPEALAKFAGHPYAVEPDTATGRDEQALGDVLAVLRARIRHDFTGYRKPTLLRRVRRRMSLGQFGTIADYVRRLRQTPAEVTALADDLLIHVTGFFRDPGAWAVLRDKVIQPLAAERADGGEVRCWVSACATGEEAYTLAILLLEAAEAAGKRFDVKVFATDMADRALGAARAGLFPNGIESEVTPERLLRFFDKDDSFYRVKKELRELVIFAPQNLLQDPPFSRLDIASCRNLLIYLEPDTQKRVLGVLHFGLREGGALLLGSSESVAPAEGDFEPIDKRHRLFRRVGPTRAGSLAVPALTAALREARPAPLAQVRPLATTAAQMITRALLDRHTPAAVAVDGTGQVVYVHGDTARYLSLPAGGPTLDLLALANDHVRGAVRTALHRAADTQVPVAVRDGLIDSPHGPRRVEVAAAPLAPQGAAPLYLVTFRDYPELPPPTTSGDMSAGERLADELQRTRNELQSALEEMQSSNEELKASHEEATSLNEELQSTNEELETSKEEMQSLNEELVTVNAQLQGKMAELEAAANDLGSLLTSTDIAVLFLDTRFRIRRFTPAVKDLLDLIPSDVGRPFANMRRKFTDPGLLDDAREVLGRLVPIERPIESESGRHYLRRILAYRTQDNRIDGVVVAFVDVTDRRASEQALAEEKEYAESIVETLHEPLLVLHPDLTVRSANPAFYGHFRVEPAETIGRRVYSLGNGQWDIPALRTLLEDVLPANNVFDDYEVTHTFATLGRRVMLVNGRRLDHKQLILLGVRDVTDRKRAEERRAFVLKLSDALHPLADPVAIEVEATRVLGEHLGVGRAFYAEVEPDEDHILIQRDFTAAGTASIAGRQRLSSFGSYWVEGYRAGRTLATPDFREIGGSLAAAFEAIGVRACVGVPVNKGGKLVGVLIVHSATPRDWTPLEVGLIEETAERTWAAVERAKAEEAVRASEARLRAVAANLPHGAAFLVGPDLRYTLAEGQALSAAGFTPADFEGRTPAEALPPDLAAEHESYYRQALAGEPFRTEHAGHGRRLVTHGRPLRDAAGRVTAVLAVSYDITDLRRAEERLQLALDAARMGIWAFDPAADAHTRDANLNRLLGLPPAESTQPFAEFLSHVHPADRDQVRAGFDASLREGRPLNEEFRVVRPDGSVRWLRDQGDVFPHAAAGGRWLAGGACVDVTERREAEDAVRASKERMQQILASATDYAILTVDDAGRVTGWSPGAAATFGYAEDEMIGRPVDDLFTPEDRAAGGPEWERETARREGRATDERWHLRKDGSRFFASGVLTRLAAGGFVKVARDLTDRKRMEDDLRDARTGLERRVAERTAELAAAVDALEAGMARGRELARRLSVAQEDERKRVSRDLHDTVGQTHAALVMALRAAVESVPTDGEGGGRLAYAAKLADGMGRELHEAAVRLRPTALDDMGLEPALRELAATWSRQHGPRVDLHADTGGRLPDEVETALYRLVQEALTNVARHAQAERVSVVVTRQSGAVTAVVEDDGVGFDVESAGGTRLGLRGMRERVTLLGGELVIESTPGGGTSIIARVPLS